MTNDNTRGLNCPDRQTESTENDPTCPECDTLILALVTHGPGEHFLDPCGCRVPTASVRSLAGGADQGRGVATDGGTSSGGTYRSPAREFGHARRGYAVEFNLDGVCACRTLTLETRAEAETFEQLLESRDDTGSVRVVRDD